jgi:SAM-dependent MidA family methyltransferase
MSPAIPFEQFMEQALHDPKNGYYARRIQSIGRSGDFTTAPLLSEAPARAIARWASQAFREFDCLNLIEIGPGTGILAASVLRHLPWFTRLRTRLHLVETSVPLANQQRLLLERRASWHRSPQEALTACKGHAILYSNEWVDAFPVRRFQKTLLSWQEMAVGFDEQGRAHESLLAPAGLPDSSGFLEDHPLGQCIEVHDSFRRHLGDWMPAWKSGRMLTIDYGATADRLYHRRPQGSLRAYLLQQCLEGPAIYLNPGRQDITADVNFTDLQNWSRPWCPDQKLTRLCEFLQDFPAERLSDPYGAGDAFLVLDQKRNA